jgi:hypothetical protein
MRPVKPSGWGAPKGCGNEQTCTAQQDRDDEGIGDHRAGKAGGTVSKLRESVHAQTL